MTVADSGTYAPDMLFDWLPQYTLPLRIIDSLVETLRPRKRDDWVRIRDAALALWAEPTGLFFTVETGEPKVWAGGYRNSLWPSMYTQNAITFVQLVPTEEYSMVTWAPHLPPAGGLVGLGMPRLDRWWEKYRYRSIRQIVCHEFGHALGFGHHGDGVMMGQLKPDEAEIAQVISYYHLD